MKRFTSVVRRSRALVVIAATTAGLTLAMPSPASAHDTISDRAPFGFGSVLSQHTFVGACDERTDGVQVGTRYTLQNGVRGTVWDPDGGEICVGRTVTSTANPVVEFHVCLTDIGNCVPTLGVPA